jgi:hypothetical protein
LSGTVIGVTLWLAVYVLAAMRITRLINFDQLLDVIHVRAAHKWSPDSWQVEFLRCPWCVGMWVSLASVWFPIWKLEIGWWWYLPLALATSMVIGMAAPLSSEDDELVPK